MLGQTFGDLPALDACLVDFARTLTGRPWAIGPADIGRLAAAGLPDETVTLVIGLVAMFNYLTRVADGTGVEADYGGELPRFVYRGRTEAVPRPGPQEWPPVDGPLELLALLPGVTAAWNRWRAYLLDGPSPLPEATRRRLRAIAARNACDSSVEPPDPAEESGDPVARFAGKLSRTPWLMAQPDVDELRATGLDDLAVLHVIATVAYQSAESRLRIGLSALARHRG
ncbi:hypothetical protein [Jatrophihabitans sp.]|uniref:hypothetical protein n=1 Tax=Jatrophihabitans sp. TaxID=1932789 RepID=UPI002CB18E22|nr:hypothetical protein [Jatrophihabitans sp.]